MSARSKEKEEEEHKPNADGKGSTRSSAPTKLIKELAQLDDEILGSLVFLCIEFECEK